jgi:hypothetical protein
MARHMMMRDDQGNETNVMGNATIGSEAMQAFSSYHTVGLCSLQPHFCLCPPQPPPPPVCAVLESCLAFIHHLAFPSFKWAPNIMGILNKLVTTEQHEGKMSYDRRSVSRKSGIQALIFT